MRSDGTPVLPEPHPAEHPDFTPTIPTPRTTPEDVEEAIEIEDALPEEEPLVAEDQVGHKGPGSEAIQDFFRKPSPDSPAAAGPRVKGPPRPPPSPESAEDTAGDAAGAAPAEKGKRVTSQGVCDVCGRNPVWSVQHQRWWCEHCRRII